MAGLLIALVAVPTVAPAGADTFTVSNTDDSAPGSLRWAIEQANGNLGPDQILFDIPGAASNLHVIRPESELPIITDTVTIDGYTQGDATPNTEAEKSESNARIRIVLDGSSTSGRFRTGLVVEGSGSTVQGLAFMEWNEAALSLGGLGGHTVAGNWFGVSPSGMMALHGRGIEVSSSDCTIGSPSPAGRNVITSSSVDGILVFRADRTLILNNVIGLDPSGDLSQDFQNTRGVNVRLSEDTVIGEPGAGNLIANSKRSGVVVHASTGTTVRANVIQNNGGLGIDLEHTLDPPTDVTPNDPDGDADRGANNQRSRLERTR